LVKTFSFYPGSGTLATQQELSDFLVGIEKRAFRQIRLSVRDEETALDLVQDAMLKLVSRYTDHTASELLPLFLRILQNTLRDHFRRQKLRDAWSRLFSDITPASTSDEAEDFLEDVESPSGSLSFPRPEEQLHRQRVLAAIENEIARLPARQREAFVFRYWYDIDILETSKLMGCSEGSVKTHCSRATATLSAALRAQGITL
jgi:RNA polymerase sigma-70 factor (ECF subfamily)